MKQARDIKVFLKKKKIKDKKRSQKDIKTLLKKKDVIRNFLRNRKSINYYLTQ